MAKRLCICVPIDDNETFQAVKPKDYFIRAELN